MLHSNKEFKYWRQNDDRFSYSRLSFYPSRKPKMAAQFFISGNPLHPSERLNVVRSPNGRYINIFPVQSACEVKLEPGHTMWIDGGFTVEFRSTEPFKFELFRHIGEFFNVVIEMSPNLHKPRLTQFRLTNKVDTTQWIDFDCPIGRFIVPPGVEVIVTKQFPQAG